MRLSCWLVFIIFIISCKNSGKQPVPGGQELAKTYCGSCHAAPDPGLLDENSWRNIIMPAMAKKMGVDYIYELAVDTMKQLVAVEDFKKITDWYYKNAPDTMAAQGRSPVEAFTKLFTTRSLGIPEGQFPSTSFVKIDPGNHWVYAANAFDSSIEIYDKTLRRVSETVLKGALVDIDFNDSLKAPGARQGILTFIGIMNPNDRRTGAVYSFEVSQNGKLNLVNKLLDSLPRPVQASGVKLNMTGDPGYLVCGFGNNNGALLWITMDNKGQSIQKSLRSLPGAIKTYVDDFNKDGLPDIMVLMAQAQEGIYLLLNKGDGNFETRQLLSFPVIYGSSSFELDDFNKDGYKDILYTCGDNGDYTGKVLKNYHGIYIFLNDAKNNFSQKYFFPLHGCYKATARDFDMDGDLDIAAISYFPDLKNQPQESFVYLEQTTAFQFKPYTINEFNQGRWLTIDAGDIDGDGDEDIVLGSLIPPYRQQAENWQKANKQKSAVLLLENKFY